MKEALLGYGMLNQVRDFASRVKSGDIRFDPQSTLFFLAGGLNDGRLRTGSDDRQPAASDRNDPREPRRPARDPGPTADEDPAIRRRRPPTQSRAASSSSDREGRSARRRSLDEPLGTGIRRRDGAPGGARHRRTRRARARAGRLFDQGPDAGRRSGARSSSTTRVIPRRRCTGSWERSCSKNSRAIRRAGTNRTRNRFPAT